MALDIHSPIDYIASNQDALDKLQNAKLNRLYAEPERQAGLQKVQMQNQFYPLQQLISSQNALSYSNLRGNPASDYLRAIANLPAQQRSLYLSYPENQKTYQNMINIAQQKMQQGGMNQNPLTPELVNSFFRDYLPQGQQQNAISQSTVPSPNTFAQAPTPMPTYEATQSVPQYTSQHQPHIVEPPIKNEIPGDLSQASESLPQITSVPIEWANMKQQNDAHVGNKITDRRDGAVAIEYWLMDNRPQITDSLKAASKYASYWGMAKEKKDQFLSSLAGKDPKGYTDLQWYENTFIPNMSNGIKVMENLNSTNNQRKELHEMGDALTSHKVNSKQSIELFNKQMRSLFDVANSAIKAAEPIHKGVTRNIYNLPEFKGDYIEIGKPKNTYSSKLGGSIAELVNSGKLTKEYYLSLPPEQRAAIAKHLGGG